MYRFEHLLLLTGTPLQNNTEELWTLLNFLSEEDFSYVNRARIFMHACTHSHAPHTFTHVKRSQCSNECGDMITDHPNVHTYACAHPHTAYNFTLV